MLKKILLLTLVALMLALFCACNSTDANNSSTDATEPEQTNDQSVPDGTAPENSMMLSGQNRVRIVYATGNKKLAIKIQDKLSALDPLSASEIGYYKITSDESAATDETPEILVGLVTNRIGSSTAIEELPTYLDYTISRVGDNIAIIANTPERLEEAVNKFLSLIEAHTIGGVKQLFYVGGNYIIDSYTGYTNSGLKLGATPIDSFSVVIPENATDIDKDIANDIVCWLQSAAGVSPKITDDSESEQEFEILIGKTNRAASADITDGEIVLDSAHYCIRMKDGKLVIAASDKRGYVRAFSDLKSMIDGAQNQLKDGTDVLNSESTRSLDGKNILVVGNSFVYYGRCVIEGDQKTTDLGYLYEICKRNGDDVNVYDYVWGGKSLEWIYDNHLSQADPEFLNSIDIVFLSEAGNNNADLIADIEEIAALFPKTTEFYYLSHTYVYQANLNKIIDAFPKLVEMGILVGDWGAIAYDLWTHNVVLDQSEINYDKETFVKNKGDQHHQNMLSGYITAQMAYCLASGKSAVGQDYSFCCDPSVNSAFDADAFIREHYNEGITNMDEVFASEYDMLEIQKLIDLYIEKYNYS